MDGRLFFCPNKSMRVMLKGNCSDWRRMTGGVPQGTAMTETQTSMQTSMTAIMFPEYINNVPDDIRLKIHMNMFADNANIRYQT